MYYYMKYKKRRQKQTVKQSLNSHNKVHFAYGKHTYPQLPNDSLTVIDSHINSATGSSQDMSQCYCRMENTVYHNPTAAKSYKQHISSVYIFHSTFTQIIDYINA